MTVRHAVTMNGRISFALEPLPGGGSANDRLRSLLARLDGEDSYAFVLWRLPDGVPLDEVKSDSYPQEYLQCAGGLSGRFTCEIRRLRPDGSPSHEVIGRPRDSETSVALQETIQWGKGDVTVQRNEVLDRDELVELFESYLAAGVIPASYKTRVLAI